MNDSLTVARASVGLKGRAAAGLVLLALAALVLGACAGAGEPPVANAGADMSMFAGYPVTLDGGGSTGVDGEESTYAWAMVLKPEGSQAELSGADTASPTFTPDVLGQFVFQLQVTDGRKWSAPAVVNVLSRPWFTDATEEAGVGGPTDFSWALIRNFANPEGLLAGIDSGGKYGAAWGDYDNDGDWDLHVSHPPANLLYRNNGDGTFTDVADEAGVSLRELGVGYAKGGGWWGDYDRDGDLDLFVSERGGDNFGISGKGTHLFENNGDGTFTDVTVDAGDFRDIESSSGAAWGDYDADGYLDLGVGTKFGRDFLYHNNGDGTFTDVAPELNVAQYDRRSYAYVSPETIERLREQLEERGITETDELKIRKSGATFEPLWLDYNNDNNLDLFWVVEKGTSYLYKNNGDGTFTEVTDECGIALEGGWMGIDAADFDRDGDLDMYLSNFGHAPLGGFGAQMAPQAFWRNNGDGTFSEVSSATGTRGRGATGWGVSFFDYDNDGDVDLAAVFGEPRNTSRWEREVMNMDLLFRNNGDGTFTDDFADIAGIGLPCLTMGLATADYDGDGDQDLFVNCNERENYLYRNDVANYLGNNWLKVRLKGTESNEFGVGAVVKVTSGGITQMEQLFAGGNLYSQDAQEFHFGLADETVVEKIEIRWPSDIIQTLTDVQGNQTLTVTEAR